MSTCGGNAPSGVDKGGAVHTRRVRVPLLPPGLLQPVAVEAYGITPTLEELRVGMVAELQATLAWWRPLLCLTQRCDEQRRNHGSGASCDPVQSFPFSVDQLGAHSTFTSEGSSNSARINGSAEQCNQEQPTAWEFVVELMPSSDWALVGNAQQLVTVAATGGTVAHAMVCWRLMALRTGYVPLPLLSVRRRIYCRNGAQPTMSTADVEVRPMESLYPKDAMTGRVFLGGNTVLVASGMCLSPD